MIEPSAWTNSTVVGWLVGCRKKVPIQANHGHNWQPGLREWEMECRGWNGERTFSTQFYIFTHQPPSPTSRRQVTSDVDWNIVVINDVAWTSIKFWNIITQNYDDFCWLLNDIYYTSVRAIKHNESQRATSHCGLLIQVHAKGQVLTFPLVVYNDARESHSVKEGLILFIL